MQLDQSRPVYINYRAGVREDQVNELMHLITALHSHGFEEAHLMISSPGGSVIRGLEVHNFLRSIPIKITTYNTGSVDSIANIIYLAGERRYVNRNANFLMHGVTWHFPHGAGEQQLEEALAAVRRDQRSIAETISNRTKLAREEIETMFRGDTILTPDDALKMGISHQIQDAVVPEDAQLFVITNSRNGGDD